jgi:hypothetical protein
MRLVTNFTRQWISRHTREAAAIDYMGDIHIPEAVGVAGKELAVKNS